MASSKSTRRSPAFQFYPKDFLTSSKVLRMSNTEVGIYIKLLSVCWLDGGLPSSQVELARIVGIPTRQFTKLWTAGALAECFTEKNGKLINARLEMERKAQKEFREKQRDNAARRWQSQTDANGIPPHPSGNAKQLPSSSQTHALQSASALKNVHTHTENARTRAPIHQTHRSHAACGRICVPASLHANFVRLRNHDDADKELRDWYLAVDNEWSVGARKGENTGGDEFKFWRARFDERWPAAEKQFDRPAPLPPWKCRHVQRCANREMCASATILGRPTIPDGEPA